MKNLRDEYDRIVRPIQDRMIRAIWRIVQDADDAEDAMQNALAIIWTRWERVRGHVRPQALIMKICIDAAYDVLRRRIRVGRTHQLRETAAEFCEPADELAKKEQRAEIASAISRLSRHQAVATLMRIVEEEPYEDIAAALGCAPATARRHVARGRERLRLLLAHLTPND